MAVIVQTAQEVQDVFDNVQGAYSQKSVIPLGGSSQEMVNMPNFLATQGSDGIIITSDDEELLQRIDDYVNGGEPDDD